MAVKTMDKPTGPSGILSSNRKGPRQKGTRPTVKSSKGLVCSPGRNPMKGRR